MESVFKCWKPVSEGDSTDERVIKIDGAAYTLQDATEEEIENGRFCLENLCIERQYKTQVAGLGRVYYDMRSEMPKIGFEELIFGDGKCIGVYHAELIFLIYHEKTHYQKKYLGEMITGPDRSVEFYDHFYLRCK